MDGDGRCHLYLSHSLSLSLFLIHSLMHSLSLSRPGKFLKAPPIFVSWDYRAETIYLSRHSRSLTPKPPPEVSGLVMVRIWAEMFRDRCQRSHSTFGRLRSTEVAFLLPTQQLRVQIPAPLWFFSLYCLVCDQYWDPTDQVLSNGFHKCS